MTRIVRFFASVFCVLFLVVSFLFCISLFVLDNKAWADDWPKNPIRILVPYGAGGSTDAMARGLAKYWEKHLGVPIIVDNRPGASSQVGVTIYSKLPADGNTILASCQPYFSVNIIIRNADYRLDQFEMINMQQEDVIEIMVLNDSPYKNAEELFNAIKDNPGKVKCGYISGGPQNIAANILRKDLGLDFKHITYEGGNDLRIAFLGGHLDFMIGNGSGDISVIGKARPLVILGQKRSKYFPECPTFNEAFEVKNFTFPHIAMITFVAVHASLKEKYPERYNKILETYKATLEDPEYLNFLDESELAQVTQYLGPEKSNEVNQEIHEFVKKYKEYVY